jgi:transcriptional regulator with XRE-family HTH domain
MNLVRRLREERGWSQDHLASVAGLGKRTIQRLELGQVSPCPETTMALAQALGVEPGELSRNSGLRARLRTLMRKWRRQPPTPEELAELPDDLRPGFTAFYDGLARLKAEEEEIRRIEAQSSALHDERMKSMNEDAIAWRAIRADGDYESTLRLLEEMRVRAEGLQTKSDQSAEISRSLFERAGKHVALAADLTMVASRVDAVLYSYGVIA